MEKKREEFKAN
jgi:hypothetical protein